MNQLLEQLRQTTYKNVADDQLQVDTLHPHVFMARGSAYAPPPPCESNPMQGWLTRWDCAQIGTQALAALVQARINETYAADLPSAVAKERAAWKDFDAGVTERLTKAMALPSLYERAPALFALFRAARDEMKKAQLPRSADEEPGAVSDVAEAIFKTYDDAGVSFAFSKNLPNQTGWILQDLDLARVRPWGSDAQEDKHFAALSMRGQATSFLRDLPLTQTSPSASPVAWVKWPFDLAPADPLPGGPEPGGAARKIEQAAKKAAILAYPRDVVEDAKTETMANLLGSSASKLVWVSGRVTRLEAKDGGFSVELSHDAWKADTKCIPYGPVTGIGKNGQFTRAEKCNNTNERRTARRFRITLADWPKSVDMGDVVAVFGELQTVTAKGNKAKMSVEATLTGKLVGCSTPMPPVDAKAKDELLGLAVPMQCKNTW